MKPVVAYIQEKLHARWSPAQLCGRLEREQARSLSPETIYRFVLKDKQQGGQRFSYLRPQTKPYRKRYGAKDARGTIPGRVGIEERPALVETRVRVGDWEADWVMGKAHKGAIVTLAARACSWRSPSFAKPPSWSRRRSSPFSNPGKTGWRRSRMTMAENSGDIETLLRRWPAKDSLRGRITGGSAG